MLLMSWRVSALTAIGKFEPCVCVCVCVSQWCLWSRSIIRAAGLCIVVWSHEDDDAITQYRHSPRMH